MEFSINGEPERETLSWQQPSLSFEEYIKEHVNSALNKYASNLKDESIASLRNIIYSCQSYGTYADGFMKTMNDCTDYGTGKILRAVMHNLVTSYINYCEEM